MTGLLKALARRSPTTLLLVPLATAVVVAPSSHLAAPAIAAPPSTSPAGAPSPALGRRVDSAPLSSERKAQLTARATASAPTVATRLGLDPRERLVVWDVLLDTDGTTFVRYRRTFVGLPVVNGDLVVRVRAADHLTVVARAGVFAVAVPTTKPRVGAVSAGRRAVGLVPGGTRTGRAPRLVVFAGQTSAKLAWESVVVGTAGKPLDEVVYTDAQTAALLARWSRIRTDRGTGSSLYVGSVPVDTLRTVAPGGGCQYILADQVRGGHRTQDGLNQNALTSYDPFVDADNVWGNGSSSDRASAGVDAHYGAATTYDYFRNVHGRVGVDGSGHMPYSRVHSGSPGSPLALQGSWHPDCDCVTYGDGNGSSTGPMVSQDLVGHELTHAVVDRTANLTYSGESGGLDEATADIFGSLVEFYAKRSADNPDYFLFEKPYAGSSPAYLRRMDNPGLVPGNKNCWYSGIGDVDVHYSSGVGNHFFYLLAEGSGAKTVSGVSYNSPTCNGTTVAGMGRDLAGRIWYRALTRYMTTTTDYRGARAATISAATDLFGTGSAQCHQVEAAWNAVAVPVSTTQCAGNSPPSSVATANAYYTNLFSAYGDGARCADWSGADGTQSVVLPSGKRAWFFADTYLNAPGERPGFNRSVLNNSVVVQNGTSLRTITGGNTCREQDQSLSFWDRYAKTPVADTSGGYYWTGDARVVGSNVVKFYYRVENTATSFKVTDTAIAVMPTDTLENATVMTIAPTRLAPVLTPTGYPLIWGTALLDAGGYTYIYGWGGMDDGHKRLYLARSAPTDLANPARWSFSRGGDSWSAAGDQAAARPVSGDSKLFVEAGFSVALVEGSYWLIQHDPIYGGGTLIAHPAAQPWGFTNSRVSFYQPPELPYDAAHKFQVVYEARVQPGLSGTAGVVLSYNVNTNSVSIGCRSRADHDASTYRPRFVDVPSSVFNSANARAPAAVATTGRAGKLGTLDGRGIRQATPPVPPAGATAALPAGTPAAGAATVTAAEGDQNWYDKLNGCPPLDQPTYLTAATSPDGEVTLDWTGYGRDIWYWVYGRDVTAGTGFVKQIYWAESSEGGDQPVAQRSQNGHTFAWYVVPFATGRPDTDTNGDGRPDNQAPASNVAQKAVSVALPSAPTSLIARRTATTEIQLTWNRTTYPSDKVYYWIYRWNVTAGQTSAQAVKQSLPIEWNQTSVAVGALDAGTTYGFYVRAENIAGYGPASNSATA